MVPPAMMTARHSFSTWAKWTAGFNSRNLTLLSDKVPGHKTNMVLLLLFFFYNTLLSSQSIIWHCAFKMVPCLCITTLPSVLLLVRAMKKPSTCIMGDADSTLSASTDPCWSAEDTANMGAGSTDKSLWTTGGNFMDMMQLRSHCSFECTKCQFFSNMQVFQFDNSMHAIYPLACKLYIQGGVFGSSLIVGKVWKSAEWV